MTQDLCFTPATHLAARIRRGDLSPVTLVDAYLDRIADRNDDVRAYITVLRDEARDAARQAEQAVAHGDHLGPLHGVPVAIKDLFATKTGVRHTYGSRVFADNTARRDSPIVTRLEAAGGIILGTTNTPEFGNRPTTDNALIGATGTPFDLRKTAGGTSGGSAAAVADGMTAAAQGSDVGGSIRIPAACCGVYGFKPSFGRVPTAEGVNAFTTHTPFNQHGPLTRTVGDAALLLDVLAGPHPSDPFTLPGPTQEYAGYVSRGIEGCSVGFSPDLGLFPVNQDVRRIVTEAATGLEAAGAAVEQVVFAYDRPKSAIQESWRVSFQVLVASIEQEIREIHGIDLLADHRDVIDPLFAAIVEHGRNRTVTEYKHADVVRTSVYEAIQGVFTEYDLLVTPTTAVPPFEKESTGPTEIDGTPADPYLDWILTWPFNMTGHPAASIPAGFTDEGLPVGLQIVGPRFSDGNVLAASGTLERERPWHDAYPPGGARG